MTKEEALNELRKSIKRSRKVSAAQHLALDVIITAEVADALVEALTPETHSCDICGESFVEDDMATLGGDRWIRMSLVAVPAECNECHVRWSP